MTINRILSLACAALILQGCGKTGKQAETQTPKVTTEQSAIPVAVVKAVTRAFIPAMEYSATLYAFREANLGAALPGRVEKIHIAEGNSVKEGGLIAELSDELLLQAEIENKTLEKDFERVSRLLAKETVAEQEYDHVKALFDASTAKLAMIRKNTEIRAPFSGTVIEHLVNEGENVSIMPSLTPGYSHSPGVVRLMQLDPVIARIEANEKDVTKIKKGQHARLRLDAYPDTEFSGQVSDIKSLVSTVSRTFTVEVRFSNPKHAIKPGMFGTVSLSLPERNGVFIPRFALMQQPGTGERYVFVAKEGTAERRVVTELFSDNDYVAVDGVTEGEDIVTDGKTKLESGAKVTVSRTE